MIRFSTVIRPSTRQCIPVLLTLATCWSSLAHASSTGADEHLISVGAGIAAPSDTSTLLENPAGFVYDQGVKLLFTGASEDSSFDSPTVGAGVFMGNGTVGGAIKFDTRTSSPSNSALTAGLGVDISAINSSLGASCNTSLGSTVSVSCSHFGLIYDPKGKLRVGVNLITGSPAQVGVGVAGDVSNAVTLALDGSTSTTGNGSAIKPGIGVNVAPVQLAVGYGFAQDAGSAMIRSGISVGLGYSFSKFHVQGYYDQLSQYFLGLAISL